jgi:ATP-dependent helicase/nuclease subunit A
MSNTANEKQQKVIDSISGIYVVDAGAGTGKTYTITERYLNILEQNKNISVDNILLVTFTRNAAANMKEKVISKVSADLKDKILDAPICSFDSFCSKLVSGNGLGAPNYLGVNAKLSNYKLVTEKVIMARIFRRFFNSFLKTNEKKFASILTIVNDSNSVLSLIETLLAKGIYPTKTGWFLDGGNKVLGDKNKFLARVMGYNNPVVGKTKTINSDLLKYFEKCLKEKKYNKSSIDKDYDSGNFLEPILLDKAFDDSSVLGFEDFVHNIYFSYIEFMVKNNYMTFSLNAMYAFLILFNNKKVRNDNSFEYVMIDEFQDTNEMQFMLILLLLKKDNLCVVGDWKQGIYGFRNASIKNITEFESKFKYYCDLIESDGESRIAFDWKACKVENLDFNVNYRSSQKVLDFSARSFDLKGSAAEEVSSVGDVVKLSSGNSDYNNYSNIEFLHAESREIEIDMILNKINSIVGSRILPLNDDGTSRPVKYSDIAILSRTRVFGLDILNRCEEVSCPAVYDGGIYLFSTEPAILLLAFAKLLLDEDCASSWITILEKENLPYLEIERILREKSYPTDILNFRTGLLTNRKVIGYIVDEIFKKYGFNDVISNKIVLILDNLFNSTLLSLSELVVFIEECINDNSDFRVEMGSGVDAVKIQTIHGSKGLEYPIVFVVNCNQSSFPISAKAASGLFYDESCGFRCKKEFSAEHNYIFESWKSDLVTYKLFSDYDEERRLMYVATTRAMFDIYLTSYRPSNFYKDFITEDFEPISYDENSKMNLKFVLGVNDFDYTNLKVLKVSSTRFMRVVSAHDVMNDFEFNENGRGAKFGSEIHNLAFRFVSCLEILKVSDEFSKDFCAIKEFVSSLNYSNVWVEQDCILKLSDSISVRGVVDCVFDLGDKLLIVDWKTDIDKVGLEEYKKQLSVYYHAVCDSFAGRSVEVCVFWSYIGEFEKIEPISKEELIKLV